MAEMHQYKCRMCGMQFSSTRKNLVFCSRHCRRNSINTIEGTAYDYGQISPGTIGAMNEAFVSYDLMSKGYHVFRAQSPSCPCDLIAMSGESVSRVEVKTAQKFHTGHIQYSRPKQGTYDVLALVFRDRTVTYIPDMPIIGRETHDSSTH